MHQPEQVNCPVCITRYVNERTVDIQDNQSIKVYECVNNHSWKKYPTQTSFTVSVPVAQNVYRPLHDTLEPVKRLFG